MQYKNNEAHEVFKKHYLLLHLPKEKVSSIAVTGFVTAMQEAFGKQQSDVAGTYISDTLKNFKEKLGRDFYPCLQAVREYINSRSYPFAGKFTSSNYFWGDVRIVSTSPALKKINQDLDALSAHLSIKEEKTVPVARSWHTPDISKILGYACLLFARKVSAQNEQGLVHSDEVVLTKDSQESFVVDPYPFIPSMISAGIDVSTINYQSQVSSENLKVDPIRERIASKIYGKAADKAKFTDIILQLRGMSDEMQQRIDMILQLPGFHVEFFAEHQGSELAGVRGVFHYDHNTLRVPPTTSIWTVKHELDHAFFQVLKSIMEPDTHGRYQPYYPNTEKQLKKFRATMDNGARRISSLSTKRLRLHILEKMSGRTPEQELEKNKLKTELDKTRANIEDIRDRADALLDENVLLGEEFYFSIPSADIARYKLNNVKVGEIINIDQDNNPSKVYGNQKVVGITKNKKDNIEEVRVKIDDPLAIVELAHKSMEARSLAKYRSEEAMVKSLTQQYLSPEMLEHYKRDMLKDLELEESANLNQYFTDAVLNEFFPGFVKNQKEITKIVKEKLTSKPFSEIGNDSVSRYNYLLKRFKTHFPSLPPLSKENWNLHAEYAQYLLKVNQHDDPKKINVKQLEEAAKILQNPIIKEISPEGYYGIGGEVFARLGKYDLAVKRMSKRYKEKPESFQPEEKYFYAISLKKIGRLEEAIAVFKDAYKSMQEDPGIDDVLTATCKEALDQARDLLAEGEAPEYKEHIGVGVRMG